MEVFFFFFFFDRCSRQNNSPLPDVHVLILGTCEYVNLYGKKASASMIKDLEMERVSWVI